MGLEFDYVFGQTPIDLDERTGLKIHPFPNGNGRHSRLMADILSEKVFSNKPFTWGGTNISTESDIRNTYIQSLKKADKGDYRDLILFARS